jgi:Transcription factor WhiB
VVWVWRRRAAARAALIDDPTRTNAEIALAEGADVAQVGDVRRRLEGLGVIAPHRVPPARFPQHVPMPRQPWQLTEGACVGHPHAGWWTSDVPAERESARLICATCHVADACLAWALDAIPGDDSAI